jgi:glyoxylase-like metal-dependent hydrolase (beta-lactamase superfamily II)
MKKVWKVLLGLVVGLVAGLAVFYFGFVGATYHGEACTWDLDLARMRALAASLPGEKPKEIRVEEVAGMDMPHALACPGSSWDAAHFRVYSYQLVYSDKTILVDTAMSPSQARDMGMAKGYDESAWLHVTRALAAASAVYVTHEHIDHMGGAFTDDKWAGNLRLTRLQLDSNVRNRPAISPTARAAVKTVGGEKYQPVAPGVVLIEAYGHTPGSQMVFVTRADGTEVLLTGDTAWITDNIDREQAPPKFAHWIMGGDRNQNACQLSALKRAQGRIAIMTGHDPDRMKALVERGVFVRGFN